MFLFTSLIQNNSPGIQFFQGIENGDIEMIIRIVMGMKEISTVDDRHFPSCRFFMSGCAGACGPYQYQEKGDDPDLDCN